MTASVLGATIVRRYVESYRHGAEEAIQSAIDLSQLGDLRTWGSASRGRAPALPRPSPASARLRGEALLRPVHLPVDDGGVPA